MVAGAELTVAIPRQALGLGDGPFQFEFKWADNIQNDNSIEEFTINGDAAPPGRFNFLYSVRASERERAAAIR